MFCCPCFFKLLVISKFDSDRCHKILQNLNFKRSIIFTVTIVSTFSWKTICFYFFVKFCRRCFHEKSYLIFTMEKKASCENVLDFIVLDFRNTYLLYVLD